MLNYDVTISDAVITEEGGLGLGGYVGAGGVWVVIGGGVIDRRIIDVRYGIDFRCLILSNVIIIVIFMVSCINIL